VNKLENIGRRNRRRCLPDQGSRTDEGEEAARSTHPSIVNRLNQLRPGRKLGMRLSRPYLLSAAADELSHDHQRGSHQKKRCRLWCALGNAEVVALDRQLDAGNIRGIA